MSTEIETCISSFETAVADSTRQIRIELQEEIQKQEILKKEYEKLNHETVEVQKSISQLDEDTRNTYKTFTTSRETCEALRRSNELLRDHVNNLKDKLERQRTKYCEETGNMKQNVDRYQLKWNEYYVRYEKHPLAQKLAEKKKDLAKVEEQLKSYQSELRQSQADLFRMKCERARRNSEDVVQHLDKFVLTLASIKVETGKCLADIELTKQDIGHITRVNNSHKHTRESLEVSRPFFQMEIVPDNALSQMEIIKDNEPFHMEIFKDNELAQMEIVKDNEPFHMEIVKDNELAQMKDNEPFHMEIVKDNELAQMKDNEPFHMEIVKDNVLAQMEIVKDNEPFHMEIAKDNELNIMNKEKEIRQSSVFIENVKYLETTGTKQCQPLSYAPRVDKPKRTKENSFQLFIPQLPLSQEIKTRTYPLRNLPQEQTFKEVSDGRPSSCRVEETDDRLNESCKSRDKVSKIISTITFLNSNSYENPKCTKNTADTICETRANEEQVTKTKEDITSSPHSPLNFMKCQETLNQLKKSPGFVYKSRSMFQQNEKCETQNNQSVSSSFVHSLVGIKQFQKDVRQVDTHHEPLESSRFKESPHRMSDELGNISTGQEETTQLSRSHFVTGPQLLNLTTAKETLSVTNKAMFPLKHRSTVTNSPVSSEQNIPANDAESPNETDLSRAIMFRHQNYEDMPSTSFLSSSPNPPTFFDFGSSKTTNTFNIFGSTNQPSSVLDIFGSGDASVRSSEDNGDFSFSFTSKEDKSTSKLFNFPF